MSYRFNQLENVLRDQYETATAELEELAEEGNSIDSFERLDGSLSDLGFEKEILTKNGLNSAVVYVRKNDSGLEVLADSDLAISDRTGKLHLYQIPAGQNVQEWYSSIPDHIEWNSKHGERMGTITIALLIGSIIAGSTASIITESISCLAITSYSSIFLSGGYMGIETMKNSLSSQTITKGPKALLHIANTSFEDFVKYQSLRIEELEKPEIISLEQSQEAELESVLSTDVFSSGFEIKPTLVGKSRVRENRPERSEQGRFSIDALAENETELITRGIK